MEPDGSVRVCDSSNNSVRRVSPHGEVTSIAGNWEAGFADGVGDAARFNNPVDIEAMGV